ncbi:MAG: hypothetical protein ACTSSN_03055 [Candidatus Heimdallarchaeaceae archaeon]
MLIEDLTSRIELAESKENLREILGDICLLSSNERSNKEIILLLDKAIEKSELFNDEVSLVNLIGYKIPMIYSNRENISEVRKLISRMKSISEKNSYNDILSWVYSYIWYIEKFEGNRKKSIEALEYSLELLDGLSHYDEYIYHFVRYSYAVEQWLEKRDSKSSTILEECADFFHLNGYFHSFAKALCILVIIYQQTQNKEKSMELTKKILNNYNLLLNISEEIQSIVHYFIGVSHELSFNLCDAEKHLLKTERILKSIYKTSIYSRYYLTALSHLTSTYALQGKFELASDQMGRVEELLEEEIAIKNLDSFSKSQVIHDFNLTKFYLKSRLNNFSVEKLQDLIQTIHSNVDTYHSNGIMLSEFILNANLTKTELQTMRKLNNPSIRRVEHILDFLLFQGSDNDKQTLQRIDTLKRRPVEERMTYVERAFADLLAAQEYYKINRFLEIQFLLKNYQNHLHSIEVLELRVFMEAFIQVGAFKSGDPFGPALQYMAIKKCRNHGFSRLENRLLNYLDMQNNDIQSLAI